MLKLAITGQDTLAKAAAECCCRYHSVFPSPTPAAEILWICYDTPIGEGDRPDTAWVMDRIREDIKTVTPQTLILISSQMPVGTTAKLEREFPEFRFACSPENIRVKTAIQDFGDQARIVVGLRDGTPMGIFRDLLSPFTNNIIFTTPETAEMVKHALNCYLGMSIAFINEIARLCAAEGADANMVSLALRCDARISPDAPLRPGAPFGGGHLARDIYTVTQIARERGLSIPIIEHIRESNEVRQ